MSDSDAENALLILALGTLLILPALISETVAQKLGPVGSVLKSLGIL